MLLKQFCCCLSVKTGAMTIGIINILNLVVAITKFDMLAVALKVFTAPCFAIMLLKDNRIRRLLFFVAYFNEIMFQYIIEGVLFYSIFTDKRFPREVCQDIIKSNAESGLQPDEDMPTREECEAQIKDVMGYDIAAFLILQLIVQFHFAHVLFTHWRNSNLPQKQGGTIPQAPRQEVQTEMPDINATVSVAHAVDDESLNSTVRF